MYVNTYFTLKLNTCLYGLIRHFTCDFAGGCSIHPTNTYYHASSVCEFNARFQYNPTKSHLNFGSVMANIITDILIDEIKMELLILKISFGEEHTY